MDRVATFVEMKVVFFHRRPRQNYNFSVENLFAEVRKELPSDVEAKVIQLSYFSEGIVNRIRLCWEAFRSQGDINHVTGDINFIAICLHKKKTVLTILDVGFMKHPNVIMRLFLKWFWIILPVKRSGIVTTISHSAKQEILKYVSVNPDKIRVVYVPILSGFQAHPKTFNKNKPTILQIGTKFNKNVGRLLMALEGVSCHLILIGELDDSTLSVLAKTRVEFSSFKNLTNEQVIEKYIESDVVAFVSTYEGFGMPIVEANTIGRVVVTSNILSMPEVAGKAAHLVNPFEISSIRAGILKVIEDEAYRTSLIAEGFENRKRFNVNQISRQYSEIYCQLHKA